MIFLRMLAVFGLVLVFSAPLQAEPQSQVNLSSVDVLQIAQQYVQGDPVKCVMDCRVKHPSATLEACKQSCVGARPRQARDCMGNFKSCRRECAKRDKSCLRSCKAALTTCK
jgi:hypothetical protein